MNQPLDILNGAFEATFEKGKWSYKPTFKKPQEVKKIDKGSQKETPQYDFIDKLEKEATVRFKKVLNKMTIDIVTFLKTTK